MIEGDQRRRPNEMIRRDERWLKRIERFENRLGTMFGRLESVAKFEVCLQSFINRRLVAQGLSVKR